MKRLSKNVSVPTGLPAIFLEPPVKRLGECGRSAAHCQLLHRVRVARIPVTRVSLRALVTQPENINMQFPRSELLSKVTVDVQQSANGQRLTSFGSTVSTGRSL